MEWSLVGWLISSVIKPYFIMSSSKFAMKGIIDTNSVTTSCTLSCVIYTLQAGLFERNEMILFAIFGNRSPQLPFAVRKSRIYHLELYIRQPGSNILSELDIHTYEYPQPLLALANLFNVNSCDSTWSLKAVTIWFRWSVVWAFSISYEVSHINIVTIWWKILFAEVFPY